MTQAQKLAQGPAASEWGSHHYLTSKPEPEAGQANACPPIAEPGGAPFKAGPWQGEWRATAPLAAAWLNVGSALAKRRHKASGSPFLALLSSPRARCSLPSPKAAGILLRPQVCGTSGPRLSLVAREDGARGREQGSGKPIPSHLSRAHVRPYLHSDGCLLGHRLVHADEGHVVVQVVDRAL